MGVINMLYPAGLEAWQVIGVTVLYLGLAVVAYLLYDEWRNPWD